MNPCPSNAGISKRLRVRTLGDEKLSLGNTAPYSVTASLICASSSGNENFLRSSSSPSLDSSSSESVLSAGL